MCHTSLQTTKRVRAIFLPRTPRLSLRATRGNMIMVVVHRSSFPSSLAAQHPQLA